MWTNGQAGCLLESKTEVRPLEGLELIFVIRSDCQPGKRLNFVPARPECGASCPLVARRTNYLHACQRPLVVFDFSHLLLPSRPPFLAVLTRIHLGPLTHTPSSLHQTVMNKIFPTQREEQ